MLTVQRGISSRYPLNPYLKPRRCHKNLKRACSIKVQAAQRQKFVKEGYQSRSYDKKLAKLKLLNANLKNSADSMELFQTVQNNQQIMNAINVSTASIAAARLVSSKKIDDIQLKTLQVTYILLNQLIMQHILMIDERGVSNCLWSLGKAVDKLEIQKKQEYICVFEKLCERAVVVCNRMKTQEVSNILWAMAKFDWQNKHLIKELKKSNSDLLSSGE
eukprot:TRINITY_DN4932_c2_g2_i3.p1 TRINITY_DN4932_c2_g2~~TRINITY_DN4932_c2_g2_i3.p1  ORF type:complete len:235 (+),score=14.59 TRINITY_DN4932_c2_g2_i3:54-707(+)